MPGDPMQELMGMLGGGGPAGAGGPQPGMPPAMDAAMGQRSGMGGPPGMAPPMGGAGGQMGGVMQMLGPYISQFLGSIMNNPAAMAGIGSALSEMAGPQNDPRMRMASVGGPTAGMVPPEPAMPMGRGGPPMEDIETDATEAEMQAVHDQMGADAPEEAEWQGTRAPTQDDIDLLLSDPAAYSKSFNAKFGEGAAEQYLADDDEDDYEDDGDSDSEYA